MTEADIESPLKEIRTTKLNTYANNPQRITQDFKLEAADSADYSRRFIFEFLQNADDEMPTDSSKNRDVQFELHEDRLLVANTGRAFDTGDLETLTTLTRTTKGNNDDEATIDQDLPQLIGIVFPPVREVQRIQDWYTGPRRHQRAPHGEASRSYRTGWSAILCFRRQVQRAGRGAVCQRGLLDPCTGRVRSNPKRPRRIYRYGGKPKDRVSAIALSLHLAGVPAVRGIECSSVGFQQYLRASQML